MSNNHPIIPTSNAYFKSLYINSCSIYLMANSKQPYTRVCELQSDFTTISAIASQETDDPRQYENIENKTAKHTYVQRYDKKILNKILFK